MGILGFIVNALLNDFNSSVDKFDSGYGSGYHKATSMSDAELKKSLQNKAKNGVSDWKSAGECRAMADEYKRRKGE